MGGIHLNLCDAARLQLNGSCEFYGFWISVTVFIV